MTIKWRWSKNENPGEWHTLQDTKESPCHDFDNAIRKIFENGCISIRVTYRDLGETQFVKDEVQSNETRIATLERELTELKLALKAHANIGKVVFNGFQVPEGHDI